MKIVIAAGNSLDEVSTTESGSTAPAAVSSAPPLAR